MRSPKVPSFVKRGNNVVPAPPIETRGRPTKADATAVHSRARSSLLQTGQLADHAQAGTVFPRP